MTKAKYDNDLVYDSVHNLWGLKQMIKQMIKADDKADEKVDDETSN